MDAVNTIAILLNMHTSGYPIEEMVAMLEDVLSAERKRGRAEERAAEEERNIQAVISVVNDIDTYASEGYYQGYKQAIRNVLAAIRGAPVEGDGKRSHGTHVKPRQ
jgi:hypothetical protein